MNGYELSCVILSIGVAVFLVVRAFVKKDPETVINHNYAD